MIAASKNEREVTNDRLLHKHYKLLDDCPQVPTYKNAMSGSMCVYVCITLHFALINACLTSVIYYRRR